MQRLFGLPKLLHLVVFGLLCATVISPVVAQDPTVTDPPPQGSEFECDVCVYGGTASGMMAAISASQAGKSVIVVEPSRWLGGIVGGGIRGMTDCKYREEIGGLALMMMEEEAQLGGSVHSGQNRFRQLFVRLAQENNLQVIYQHRLGEVVKEETIISTLRLDYAPPAIDGCPPPEATTVGNLTVSAKMFIDASYEGDLMARSGVSYVVGRESQEQYGESLGGQRNLRTFNMSPYIVADDPESGLLPMVDPDPYEAGAASRHIMGYNFRMQWVADGHPMGEPSQYDEDYYALARRALVLRRAGDRMTFNYPCKNFSRAGLISSGIPGLQADFPDADWPERSRIWRAWIDHNKIMHRLFESEQMLRRNEYPESDGFPNQLYIRLGRRMVTEYVMTQHDLMCQRTPEDSVGLAYYQVDIYPCRLVATADGRTATEGETFTMVSPGPYQIPYRSIRPQAEECGNLLVPVCMAASHVAMASIRMEPSYMVMGESAGIAAVRAIEENTTVQNIDPAAYQRALAEAGQVVEWDGTRYGAGKRGWWTSHPEQFQDRPIDTIFATPAADDAAPAE